MTDGNGITWTINHPSVTWGAYATGGVWVKLPTGVSTLQVLAVSPAPVVQRSGPLPTDPVVRVRNGTMKNVLGPFQLGLDNAATVAQRNANVRKSAYDTRVAGKWSNLGANWNNPDPWASPTMLPSLGGGANPAYQDTALFEPRLVVEYPIDVGAGDCLVSTISNPEQPHAGWNNPEFGDRTWETVVSLGTGEGPALGGSPTKSAAVLVCLPASEVVPTDAFRPAYAGYSATRFGMSPHFALSQVAANTSTYTTLKRLSVPNVWPNDLLNPYDIPRASFLSDQTIGSGVYAGLARFFGSPDVRVGG